MRRSRAVILGSIALSLCAALLIGSRLPGRRAEPAVMQQETAQEEVRLPIVMYHSVVDDPARQGDYVVTPQTVREDLQYLKSRGYQSVTLAQLVDYVYHGGDLPEKPVLITFDDGCYNNYQYVLPILQQLEMTAVISPVASWSEQADADGSEHTIWSYLRGERMLEMAMTGYVEFANHSYDLHQVGARKGALRKTGEGEEQYRQMLEEDTSKAQQYLLRCGLTEPVFYTYPFGALSALSETYLKEMGFLGTFGCGERVNVLRRDPDCLYQLGRFNRPAGQSSQEFFSFLPA